MAALVPERIIDPLPTKLKVVGYVGFGVGVGRADVGVGVWGGVGVGVGVPAGLNVAMIVSP